MTKEEENKIIAKRMLEIPDNIRDVHTKIAEYARGLIPVLKDAGRLESAKPLEELYFQLDVLHQEMEKIAREHMDVVQAVLFGALKEKLEGEKRR